jgi:hypothetical protein
LEDVLKALGAAVVRVGDLLMLTTLGIKLSEHANFTALFVVSSHGSKAAEVTVVHSKKDVELVEVLGANCPRGVGKRIAVFNRRS